MSAKVCEDPTVGSRSEPLTRRFRRGSFERQDSVEEFVLAPSSPLLASNSHQLNGETGTGALSSTHSFLSVPQLADNSYNRSGSAPPSPSREDSSIKSGKVKEKSHFSMFKLHKHKNKLKKHLKESREDTASLSQSVGSTLFKSKKQSNSLNRRSFSGVSSERSVSPAGLSTNSFPATFDSEGESEDELLKTLTNPTGFRHTPSPLLQTPTPYQQHSSIESDWGPVGGDNVSIAPSHNEGSNLVDGAVDIADSPQSSLQYMVSVTLQSGHNLAIRDRTGSSDPYVKFKCGRFKYRSAVIHRNLNPEWNESFSFKSSQLDVPLRIRVYDHDYGSLDDFMGGQTVDLTSFVVEQLQMIDLGLEDPAAEKKGESLGFIRLFIRVSREVEEDSLTPQSSKTSSSAKDRGTQIWSKVLNVTLLKGQGLPAMDDNGFSDPYCKFKLGPERFESSVQSKTLNPRFYERFMLHMYDHDSTMLHIEVWDRDFPNPDDFIGSCSVNLSQLKEEEVHSLVLNINAKGGGDMEVGGADDMGTIHCLLQITSTNVEEESESHPVDMELVRKRYGLSRTYDVGAFKKKDIGHLQVKIESAEELPLTDSYVIVKVGCKCVAQTKTVGKSASPEWNQTFHFNVEDVNDELEVLVYKVKGEHLIGKVKLPLHRLESGVSKDYVLKKPTSGRTKGLLHMTCHFVYHPVRAGIRVFTARDRVPEERQKLQTKVLMNNIRRVMAVINTIQLFFGYYSKMWSWEDRRYSFVCLVVFTFVCLFGQLWIACFLLVVLFACFYMIVYARGRHVWQLRRSASIQSNSTEDVDGHFENISDFSDLDDDLDAQEKTNFRGKIKQFQHALVIVQDILGVIGDYDEKIRNLFNWTVPFLCWTAIAVLLLASTLFYFVPLRYVILIWGWNKFSKRLRNSHYIDNNELTDFLSRCPTNQQLDEWREYSSHPAIKRQRSRKPRKGKMKNNASDPRLKKKK